MLMKEGMIVNFISSFSSLNGMLTWLLARVSYIPLRPITVTADQA